MLVTLQGVQYYDPSPEFEGGTRIHLLYNDPDVEGRAVKTEFLMATGKVQIPDNAGIGCMLNLEYVINAKNKAKLAAITVAKEAGK